MLNIAHVLSSMLHIVDCNKQDLLLCSCAQQSVMLAKAHFATSIHFVTTPLSVVTPIFCIGTSGMTIADLISKNMSAPTGLHRST
jgi:hypothetical protein